MARYAQGTTIEAAKTEQDIKSLLRAHGATGSAIAAHSSYGGAPDRIQVAFELAGRHIRCDARLPWPDDERYDHDSARYRCRERPATMQRAAWEQDVRQRWRALLLRIRARLEELEDLCTLLSRRAPAPCRLRKGDGGRDAAHPARGTGGPSPPREEAMSIEATDRGGPALGPAREWPALLASSVLHATDTRTAFTGRLNEAREGTAPRGRPGEVVAVAPRAGRPEILTLLGEPNAMRQMAQAAGMKPLVVALFGSDGQMRAISRG